MYCLPRGFWKLDLASVIPAATNMHTMLTMSAGTWSKPCSSVTDTCEGSWLTTHPPRRHRLPSMSLKSVTSTPSMVTSEGSRGAYTCNDSQGEGVPDSVKVDVCNEIGEPAASRTEALTDSSNDSASALGSVLMPRPAKSSTVANGCMCPP